MIATLVLHWLLAATAPAVGKSIWLLQSTGWQREETALLSALRIYTRDLKIPITISMVPSRGETREAQREDARIRCTLDASLVAWFSGDDAAPELFVMRCASEEEYRLPLLPAKDPDLAAQTLALKMRGLLTEVRPAEVNKDDALPVASKPISTEPLKAKPAPDFGLPTATQTPTGPAPAINSGPNSKIDAAGMQKQIPAPSASGHGQRNMNLEGGLEWVYGTTSGFSGIRQGLLWRLAAVSTRLPFALEVDGSLVTSVSTEAPEYRLIVSDIPVGVALSARLIRPLWTISIGPRVSVHRIQADGFSSTDLRSGSTTEFVLGLGALEHVRLKVSDKVSIVLSLSNEAVIPRQQFTVDGKNKLEVGRYQWTLSAGVVVHP